MGKTKNKCCEKYTKHIDSRCCKKCPLNKPPSPTSQSRA